MGSEAAARELYCIKFAIYDGGLSPVARFSREEREDERRRNRTTHFIEVLRNSEPRMHGRAALLLVSTTICVHVTARGLMAGGCRGFVVAFLSFAIICRHISNLSEDRKSCSQFEGRTQEHSPFSESCFLGVRFCL